MIIIIYYKKNVNKAVFFVVVFNDIKCFHSAYTIYNGTEINKGKNTKTTFIIFIIM